VKCQYCTFEGAEAEVDDHFAEMAFGIGEKAHLETAEAQEVLTRVEELNRMLDAGEVERLPGFNERIQAVFDQIDAKRAEK
jgi:hypothetical protein